MDVALTEAVAQTRDELGTDVYLFLEGDERHFLGDPVTLAIAAWVVGAFLHGFTEAAKGDIESWGKRAYTWLRDQVAKAFTTGDAAGVQTEADSARAIAADTDVTAYARASDTALRAALEAYGLDWASAERVATKAREAGLKAIGA